MASKYEILASVIKREQESIADDRFGDYYDDGNWQVLIHVLSILHNAEEGPRPGGPNNPIDWEAAAEAIYSQIAFNHSVIDFNKPAPYERFSEVTPADRQAEVVEAERIVSLQTDSAGE
jgi:hypothetical protein